MSQLSEEQFKQMYICDFMRQNFTLGFQTIGRSLRQPTTPTISNHTTMMVGARHNELIVYGGNAKWKANTSHFKDVSNLTLDQITF